MLSGCQVYACHLGPDELLSLVVSQVARALSGIAHSWLVKLTWLNSIFDDDMHTRSA